MIDTLHTIEEDSIFLSDLAENKKIIFQKYTWTHVFDKTSCRALNCPLVGVKWAGAPTAASRLMEFYHEPVHFLRC